MAVRLFYQWHPVLVSIFPLELFNLPVNSPAWLNETIHIHPWHCRCHPDTLEDSLPYESNSDWVIFIPLEPVHISSEIGKRC